MSVQHINYHLDNPLSTTLLFCQSTPSCSLHVTTAGFMICLVFQRKPCTPVLLRSGQIHTSNHITPRPNELQVLYKVHKGHDQVLLRFLSSHTQNAAKGHWIHSVTYCRPSHTPELLLWISLHRPQSGIYTGKTAASQQTDAQQTDAQQISFGDHGDPDQSKCQDKEFGLLLVSVC